MAPNSATQIGVGLGISLLGGQALTALSPHVDASNDSLCSAGQTQVSLVFLCLFLVFARPLEAQDGALRGEEITH